MSQITDALPDLDPGVTLLRGGDRGALAALVCSELHARDGVARWVDARNHATTYPLVEAARRPRALDRILVARAFTAHQHHSLVRQLVADVARPTALVVAPAVDDLYADDDLLDGEATRLRDASLSTLRALAESCAVPVVVTASDPDAVSEYADATVEVEQTAFGPRFEGAGGETTAYRTRGGWQTTIPYWVELFGVADDVDVPAPALPRQEVFA